MPVQLLIVSAIVFGPVSGWLAGVRGRPRLAWFLFGTVLGPLAPALLLVAPLGSCRACGARSRGWRRTCLACGRRLDGSAAQEPRLAVAQARPAEAPVPSVATPIAAAGVHEATAASAVPAATAAHGANPASQAPSSRWWQATRRSTPPAEPDRVGPGPDIAAAPPEGTLETLGAGVLVGGSGGLTIGSRYILATTGDVLVIQGPVDIDPAIVAMRRSRRGLDTSIVEGRLVISEMTAGRLTFAVAFTTLTQAIGHDLERDIPLSIAAPPPDVPTVTEPALEPEPVAGPRSRRKPASAQKPKTSREPAPAPEPEPALAEVPAIDAGPPPEPEPSSAPATASGAPPPTPPRRTRTRTAAGSASSTRRPPRRRIDRERP